MSQPTGKIRLQQRLLLSLIGVLYLLTLDWWSWGITGRVFMLPLFFINIIVIQLLLTVAIFVLVRYFWPNVVEDQIREDADTHQEQG